MHAASINTRHEYRAYVLFTPVPIVERVCKMFRVTLVLCVAPAVFGIIVRDPPPSPTDYRYSYNIEDPTTGDSKSQHEVRIGDVVSGAYTVLGPDGTKRTVEYTADAKHGFQAVVREDPGSGPIVTSPRPDPNQYYNQPSARPLFPRANNQRVSYAEEKPAIYFTPDNELKTSLSFDGRYFIPANAN